MVGKPQQSFCRRLQQPEKKVLQQLRSRGADVFVVTEVLQTMEEVQITQAHSQEGSGQFTLPGALCLQVCYANPDTCRVLLGHRAKAGILEARSNIPGSDGRLLLRTLQKQGIAPLARLAGTANGLIGHYQRQACHQQSTRRYSLHTPEPISILQGEAKGCQSRRKMMTVPAGSTLAFQVAQLLIGSTWGE